MTKNITTSLLDEIQRLTGKRPSSRNTGYLQERLARLNKGVCVSVSMSRVEHDAVRRLEQAEIAAGRLHPRQGGGISQLIRDALALLAITRGYPDEAEVLAGKETTT